MELRPVIYQLLPRLFANYNGHCIPNGTIEQNGSGKMNAITMPILSEIHNLGITHMWYTGIIEHSHVADYSSFGIEPYNANIVKGKAGSPYAITDYYDIDPDISQNVAERMDEFCRLVERTHESHMKVIVDFVPNHVGRQYHSDVAPEGTEDFGSKDDKECFFKPDNDFYYIPRQQFSPTIPLNDSEPYVEFPAKATGNDCFHAFPGENDWYETVKLNYGVNYSDGSTHFNPIPPMWHKMLDVLKFWAAKGVDGFRCDMVFMVPVEFWGWVIPRVKSLYPEIIFIGELYDTGLYRKFIEQGKFDYLYDKVNLYDTLRGVQCCNVSAAQLTGCWQRIEGLSSKMLNFLENHDEQRFASDFYAGDGALVIPSLIVSSMIGTGAVMIYAGQELGEKGADEEGFSGRDGRTSIFDYWSVPTLRRWLNNGKCGEERLTRQEIWLRGEYARILKLCNSENALREGKFFDLMYVNYDNPTVNPHRQYLFIRSDETSFLIIAVNFDRYPVDLSINVPLHAFECLNMPAGFFEAEELLTGTKAEKQLSSDVGFKTRVEGFGGVVWKLTNNK